MPTEPVQSPLLGYWRSLVCRQVLDASFQYYFPAWIVLPSNWMFWWQQPYLVKGGFQSWAKNLRVKELKPETVLTALNEVIIQTTDCSVCVYFCQFLAIPVQFSFPFLVSHFGCCDHVPTYHLDNSWEFLWFLVDSDFVYYWLSDI
jgi:hypothetical protein